MKKIVDILASKGFLFKDFGNFDKSKIGTKKKIFIYIATDLNLNYHLILDYVKRSRFIVNDFNELIELSNRIIGVVGHNFKFKHIFLRAKLCSKSKKMLELSGWKVYNDFV